MLLGLYPGVELLNHMVILFLILILFFTVAVPFYIPTNKAQGFQLSASSPTFVMFWVFFKKDFIYLFLERREGREKEREQNIGV